MKIWIKDLKISTKVHSGECPGELRASKDSDWNAIRFGLTAEEYLNNDNAGRWMEDQGR